MSTLTSITLENGATIYIETAEDVENVPKSQTAEATPKTLTSKGTKEKIAQQFAAMQDTMRDYTNYALNAFKQVGGANIDKVTLEFGVKVAGEAGVPYVTKGTADATLKVTVECSFPD